MCGCEVAAPGAFGATGERNRKRAEEQQHLMEAHERRTCSVGLSVTAGMKFGASTKSQKWEMKTQNGSDL